MSENVVLLFDGDEAGMKAADRALEVFFSEPVDIRICVLPDGLDPDDLLRQEGGAERFRSALSASSDVMSFMTKRIGTRLAGRGLSGRQQMIETTLARFVDLGVNTMSGVRRHLVLQSLSDLFEIPVRELDALCRSLRPRPLATDSRPGAESDAIEWGPRGPDRDTIVEVPLGPGDIARRRARLTAERRLVAMLCVEPPLASLQVPVAGCGMLPLSEALHPDEFTDRGHSAIFAALRAAAEDGRSIGFATLLSELANQDLKRLASELYTFGEDLLRAAQSHAALDGSRRSAAEEVAASWNDLENLERRARLRVAGGDLESQRETSSPRERMDSGPESSATASQDEVSALQRLARARERGHDATAVSAFFGRRSSAGSESGRSSNQ
jgi:DNA primase